MMEMDIDKKLEDYTEQYKDNWQNLSFTLRRHLDIWVHKNIGSDLPNKLKISYLPVIFNITGKNTTRIDISRKSLTLKQSMGRTVKELKDMGILDTSISKNDKRSEFLFLTDAGKNFVLDSYQKQHSLQKLYEETVGAENMKIATEVINKIIYLHEQMNLESEEED